MRPRHDIKHKPKKIGGRRDALRHSHVDTAIARDVWIGNGMEGTECLTLCGHWLPMWEDGPDGPDNERRWSYRQADGMFPPCPHCEALRAPELR